MVDLRLGAFAPALLVPVEAYPLFIAGLLVLFACIYTYTLQISTASGLLIRLGLAPLAIRLFWAFGYGAFDTPGRQISVGMAVTGLYGIMRVIDTCFVDTRPPVWIAVDGGKPMALPTTVAGRVFYSVDLLTSLRGNSWCADRYWDFLPKSLIPNRQPSISRGRFLLNSLLTLLTSYAIFDVLDSLNKSRDWELSSDTTYPITSLPILEQFLFSTSVCVGTALSIIITYTIASTSAVIWGSSPSCWPPMFNGGALGPYAATSLTDFWGRRWHIMFRRVFARMAIPPLVIVSALFPDSPYTLKTFRALVTFAYSALLHIVIMYRLDIDARWSGAGEHSFAATAKDVSTWSFFLAQPLGLLLESLVVAPLALAFFGTKGQRIATRVWAWCFLLWSGRYWSDVWVRRGMWHPNEKVVGYSVVRGVLSGEWVV